VDQRGLPEQNSIIQFMTRNIHNIELQDFIEEAIIECFHYLDSDMRQNKCSFSENLLTCLIDKGKEVCLRIYYLNLTNVIILRFLFFSQNKFLKCISLILH